MKRTADTEKMNKNVIRVITVLGTIGGGFMFGYGIVNKQPGLIVCGTTIGIASMRFLGTTFDTSIN